jgi:ATP-dependent Lhr-like helicase
MASGPTFRADLAGLTGRLPAEVDEGLWELVARGLVHADAFGAVRNLLGGSRRAPGSARHGARSRLGLHRSGPLGPIGEGRWSIITPAASADRGTVATEQLAEEVAAQLLLRWGVVAFEHRARESITLPWREVVRALRRLEARGVVVGGRFVTGLSGEQYALADFAAALTTVDRLSGEAVTVAASDPLNITGHLLPGLRIPAVVNRTVTVSNGEVSDAARA